MTCDKSRGNMRFGYPVIGLTPSSEAFVAFGCRRASDTCDETTAFRCRPVRALTHRGGTVLLTWA
jgi:hypothetical protein